MAAPLASAGAPATAPVVPGWQLGALVGAGGFARVYRARSEHHGGDAVVKISHHLHDARLEHEAAVLRRLGPPLTPRLLEQGSTPDGFPYLALDFIDGPTVGAYLGALPGGGAAPPGEARAIVLAIGAALEQLHAAGVVHRDLKPENVILRGGDPSQVTLLDLGLALDRHDQRERAATGTPALTLRGQRLGTALYTAPEQIGDPHTVGPAADVYALAAMAFELLTGRPPFVGRAGDVEQGHLTRRPPSVSALAPLPAHVDEVLLRGLAKSPDARPPAARFAAQLADALEAGTAAPAPTTAVPLADGTPQRVALLGVHPRGGIGALAEVVTSQRGRIARISGDRVLVAFANTDSPAASVRAALQTAGALTGGAVVHLATVEVHRGRREPRLISLALDRPDWLPPPSTLGDRILLTPAAAAELPDARPATIEGFFVPPGTAPAATTDSARLPIAGRRTVVHTAVAEMRACLDTATPGFCSLVGEPGIGKSRALAAVAAALQPIVPVLLLAAGPVTRLLTQLTAAAGIEEPSAVSPAATAAERVAVAERIAAGLRRRAAATGLAVLVDDAHAADAISLDALELAAMAAGDGDGDGASSDPRCPLWICVAARPVLFELRPELGGRSPRNSRRTLRPLGRRAARVTLRRLLRPAERVPVETLDAIAAIAGGVPAHLVELVHALRALGAVRQKPGGAWYLASEDLLHVSATPLADRLAERFLARTPEPLRPFVHAVAAFGTEGVQVEELDAIRAAAERERIDLGLGDLDIGVALARLRTIGVVRLTRHGNVAVRDPLLGQALEARMPEQQRRALHALAFRLGRDDVHPTLGGHERRARHAAAAGFAEEAGRAYVLAGGEAVDAHEHARAEQWFSAALDHAEPTGVTAQAALIARARARIRLELWDGALTDLQQAAALAGSRGEAHATAECLLEQATVLDWSYRWKESAERAAEAAVHVAHLGTPSLLARLALARGRAEFRADRFGPAIDELERAADLAARTGEHETHTVALLLLAVALTLGGRPDDAARSFAEVIATCERAGDLHHLAVAHNNRIILWEALGDADAALDDARRTQTLARRLGHTTLESTASHNLAHILYFRGEPTQALALATRARDLYHRHAGQPGPEHDVLIARLHAELGDLAAVHGALATLPGRHPADAWSESATVAMQALALRHGDDPAAAAAAAWRDLLARADGFRTSFPDELIDLRRLAAEAALATRHPAAAREHVMAALELPGGAAAHWRRRLDALLARADRADREGSPPA